MPVQLQVQLRIQCSGHLCIQGQKQQEEEAHQEVPLIKEVVAAVKAVIKVVIQAHHCQEEEQVQEEQDQEERDHLHQKEAKEEAVRCRGEPHHSHQEEEQVIQGLLHLYLQVFHSLHVLQIHGVHLIDPGKHFQS